MKTSQTFQTMEPLTQQQNITSHKTWIFMLGLLTVKDNVPYPHKQWVTQE